MKGRQDIKRQCNQLFFGEESRQILSLAVPSIISNVTVPLLGLVDLTIIGHIGDAAYISAIATGSMIFNVIYWIFGFLRMGTSGLTAQAFGQKNSKGTDSVLRLSLGMGVAIGMAFVALQFLILEFMIWAMNTPADAVTLVADYFNIVIWGAPAMLSLYALNGWFIGMQNTRVPMVIAIAQNIINIVASLSLVFLAGWKVEGVAGGTLIAQWSGLLLALAGVRYIRRTSQTAIGTSGLAEDEDSRGNNVGRQAATEGTVSFRSFFSVNRDIFLRTLCLVAVNMFFTSAGGKQGSLILAVNALLITLYTLFSYFMDGFAYAAEALCGKCYGAGDRKGFVAIVKRLYSWGAVMVAVFTLLYIIGGQDFLSLLTDDEAVVRAAADYLPWTIAIPLCGVMAFIYDGVFIGITATKGMLVSSAISAVLFFAIYFVFSPSMGNSALWMAFLTFLAARGLVQHVLLVRRIKYSK